MVSHIQRPQTGVPVTVRIYLVTAGTRQVTLGCALAAEIDIHVLDLTPTAGEWLETPTSEERDARRRKRCRACRDTRVVEKVRTVAAPTAYITSCRASARVARAVDTAAALAGHAAGLDGPANTRQGQHTPAIDTEPVAVAAFAAAVGPACTATTFGVATVPRTCERSRGRRAQCVGGHQRRPQGRQRRPAFVAVRERSGHDTAINWRSVDCHRYKRSAATVAAPSQSSMGPFSWNS